MRNLTFLFILAGLFVSCSEKSNDQKTDSSIPPDQRSIQELPAFTTDGKVNVVIEISAGTNEKWEWNSSTNAIELEQVDGQPRVIEYLSYPANYGMIPSTLLAKDQGGDGDAVDVLVLGPAIPRGTVVPCKMVGVLRCYDQFEKDDKIIAVTTDGLFSKVNNIEDLQSKFKGLLEIIELWLTNYKGDDTMATKGFEDKRAAEEIVKVAKQAYELQLKE